MFIDLPFEFNSKSKPVIDSAVPVSSDEHLSPCLKVKPAQLLFNSSVQSRFLKTKSNYLTRIAVYMLSKQSIYL